MKKGCIWIMSFFVGLLTQAQITPVVSGSKNKILIGEPLLLTFELKAIERNASVQWRFPDSVDHFEVMQYDTSEVLKRQLTITSWDSGAWNFEGVKVTVPSNVSGKPVTLAFAPVAIQVEYDTTGKAVLNDIKPIIEANQTGERWIAYLVVAVAVLSLLLLIYLFRKWKQKQSTVTAFEPPLGAWEEFEKAIQQLQQAGLGTQQQQKEFFSQLSASARRYAERTLQQPFTKYTTDETQFHLAASAGRDEANAIVQVLRLADAVKFAKFAAPEQDCIAALHRVTTAIQQIHQQQKQ